ncbi:branched-chain amino acid aminotransferase [Penicillium macrosclerotiorum]|uniref:branched-chain amino acid aminotransferase n=1 Tax=Penicillium macrosclerotiorum TaxID=303699 RepID=UPI002546D03F|nr:branched-chain amino acid aminotransferase [Penicillium macrosclerotiorum]KAJ5689229.1 branched-chain amino acid aminotransferase [Penicillium macrosclerotiorum]
MSSSRESQPLDASKLTYEYTKTPQQVPDEDTAFSSDETICTDHMITVPWTAKSGWSTPELKPYGPLSLMPTASCLHYAHECFEGMKVYRGYDGQLRLFRPDRNTKRLRMSAERIALPGFNPDELKQLITALVAVDGPKWLPKDRPGAFLYIRPTLIGSYPSIAVTPPKQALLYIILGFLGPRTALEGGKRLLTSPDDMVRSWVGGFGYAKVGANYGPSVLASQEAARQGFHQILWLYGEQGQCTEAGASNFFVVWKRRDGKTELITAPLDDQLILEGVTRQSCLDLARERLSEGIEITEKRFTISDLLEAAEENRLLEAFSAGTAWFVTPIAKIHHRGKDINVPMGADGGPGEITGKLRTWLHDIMYGRTTHEWATIVS